MKSLPQLLYGLLFVLIQGVVWAEPPQASPAPVLGAEDLEWLGQQEGFRVAVRQSQVPLVFDTGEGALAGIWIDYLARLSDKLGVPVEPFMALDQGEDADLVLTTRIPGSPVIPGLRHTSPMMSLNKYISKVLIKWDRKHLSYEEVGYVVIERNEVWR